MKYHQYSTKPIEYDVQLKYIQHGVCERVCVRAIQMKRF